MSRTLLRSLLELRAAAPARPSALRPALTTTATTRSLHQTPSQIDPLPQTQSSAALPPSPPKPSPTSIPRCGGAPRTTSPATPETLQLLPLLALQPGNKYLQLYIQGQSYLVTPGDQIRLPFKMPGVVPGDVLRLNRAVAIGSRDFTLKGSPYVDETLFECRAVVEGTEAEPMRLKIKKKQRCRRTKTVRSKHKYTVLRVSEVKILAPGQEGQQ
ncbi:putative mitochondrial LSU ribosomal protein L49 precursor [Triangularia verruculosa]|uniref:Large ribosomal subunit protein bL21m n=1 Tax=Triangularia verruculosa TaxID=2587418 RepID=A0AAN6XHC4_9PEZI|nr:putative mitochondrial LSU ribosomal protein L49 precursor [Triangularia verruculosa]